MCLSEKLKTKKKRRVLRLVGGGSGDVASGDARLAEAAGCVGLGRALLLRTDRRTPFPIRHFLNPRRMISGMNEVTRILCAMKDGNTYASEQLLPLVYAELRRLAARKLAEEQPGQTLQATALVHEAYVRLVDVEKVLHWDGRGHFFVAAAEAMRRILVENARSKKSLKRGGAGRRVPMPDVAAADADDQLLALDEALARLAIKDPLAARVVELHHFAGFAHEQVAATLDVTVYQARQKWTYARAWLKSALANS
jgi:RNA polymerase sigma factor (TIGR02999 family)